MKQSRFPLLTLALLIAISSVGLIVGIAIAKTDDCLARVESNSNIYPTVQTAIDNALVGDLIKVAGTCQLDSVANELAFINQPLSIQGGYDGVNWDVSDPDLNPTTFDGQGNGRLITITATQKVTLSNLLLINGDVTPSSYYDGSGLFIGNGSAYLVHTQIKHNHGAGAGGGISTYNADLTVIDSQIYSNSVDFGTGAGISAISSSITLVDSSIRQNESDYAGGGVVASNSSIVISRSLIVGNRAAAEGGGISIGGSNSNLKIVNSEIRDNSTGGWIDGGGGILQKAGTMTIIASSIISNSNGDSLGKGGNIKINGVAQIERSIIAGGWSWGVGGGIYNSGVMTLTHVSIENNVATAGGGVMNEGYAVMIGTIVKGNGNSGIINRLGGEMHIDSSLIYTNAVSYLRNGGGIDNDGILTLTNSTVAQNRSYGSGNGGGIHNGGSLLVQNSTIWGQDAAYDNSATLHSRNGTVMIYDTIIGNNTGQPNCGSENSVWVGDFNLSDDDSCGVGFMFSSNINLQPLLDNGGATLTHAIPVTSDAYNAGSCSNGMIMFDQRGIIRPQFGQCDIGAFEVDSLPVPAIWLPIIGSE